MKRKISGAMLIAPAVLAVAVGACTMTTSQEDTPAGSPKESSSVPTGQVGQARIYRMQNEPVPDGHNSTCASPHLSYLLGGQVVSNAEVVQVSWGSGVNASVQALFEDWYPKVTGSAHLAWLSEYDAHSQQIGVGTYVKNPASNGAFTITPTNTATTLTDAQVGAEIVSQLKAQHLPQPTKDASGNTNTVYMIDFPPGITITLQGQASCQAFCAYHSSTAYSANGFNGEIYYGVHPDMGPGTGCAPTKNDAGQSLWHCGGSTDLLVAAAVTHSHELVETVTDPQNNSAWVDFANGCGEIGDICANQLPQNGQSASVGSLSIGGTTYYMQTEWSNAAIDCIVSKAAPPVDAGVDSGIDAGVDSGIDAGVDSGIDAGVDSGIDAGVDSGIDAGVDSGIDAGIDSGGGGVDSGGVDVDSGIDAGIDSGGGGVDSGGVDVDSGTDAGGAVDGGTGGPDGGGGHDSGVRPPDASSNDGSADAETSGGNTGADSGCSCETARRTPATTGAAALTGLVLVLSLLVRRRRRRVGGALRLQGRDAHA